MYFIHNLRFLDAVYEQAFWFCNGRQQTNSSKYHFPKNSLQKSKISLKKSEFHLKIRNAYNDHSQKRVFNLGTLALLKW